MLLSAVQQHESAICMHISSKRRKQKENKQVQEKEMATHSSVLALRIPGTGEPGGLLPMGSHRVGHD